MGRRRSRSNVTDFLQDLSDDIKNFIDDEVVDRGRTAERDLRRGGRNFFDYDDEGDRGGRGSNGRDDDIAELREAVKALAAQVSELAKK
jgi:hypothetical protein